MMATQPEYFIQMITKQMMNSKGPSNLCEGMASLMITCGCPLLPNNPEIISLAFKEPPVAGAL